MRLEQPNSIYEQDAYAEPLSDFARSAELLFGMTDDAENYPRFYRVAWENGQSPRIDDVLFADLTPTGARRLESKRGVFGQAQFKVQVSRLTGGTEERLVWCTTEPAPWSIQVDPDTEAFTRDFGYEPLEPSSVARQLLRRAQTVDDQSDLLELMWERGVKPDKSFSELLSKQAYRAIDQVLQDPAGLQNDPVNMDKLFVMMRTLERADPEISPNLQTQLVSRLLQAIHQPLLRNAAISSPERRESAIKILENSIERGVLPHTRRVLERVLSSKDAFGSDYITELVYDELHSRRYNALNKNIYGMKRDAFAHDFIMGTIVGRLRKYAGPKSDSHDVAKNLVKASESMMYAVSPIPFDNVYQIAREFGSKQIYPRRPAKRNLNVGGKVIEVQPLGSIADFKLVCSAYTHILAALREANPATTPDQAELDAHCVEIVRKATLPYEWNRLVRNVLRKNTDIEVDIDTGELLPTETSGKTE